MDNYNERFKYTTPKGHLQERQQEMGAVHFFAQRRKVVEYRKNDQERSESMKTKKNKRERSPQMQQVSAGLQDVLGMTQWRKEQQISDVARDRSGGR
jgi:hypothetical protein